MTPRTPRTPASALPPVAHRRAARTAQAEGAGQPGSASPIAEPGPTSSPQHSERHAAGMPSLDTGADFPSLGSAPGRGRPQDPGGSELDGARLASAGSRTFTIALPPGLRMLNLNERLHWAEESRRAREIKKAAWAVALHDKLPRLDRVSVTAEYQPPDRRHRDGDNMAKSAKHAVDGIVAAGCLAGDDKRYVTGTYCTIGEPYPLGRLVLHLTEVAATGSDSA